MKISIVVPVYNTEKTVKRCVDSIMAQSLSDFELLLINDGSTDNSKKICLELEKSDSRIKYIEKENGGLSTVRNLGIEKSVGEYITFADSDDYLDADAFDFMYNKAKETSADIVTCGYFIEYGKTVTENNCEDMLIEDDYNTPMITLKSKNTIDSAWNKLYNLDFLRKTGVKMPVGEIYEDTAFNLDLLAFKPKIAVYHNCFYHYVQNMGSITKKYNPEKLATIKKRALKLKSVTDGIDEYCDFYFIKSVFSSVIDMFLSCKKNDIMKTVSEQLSDEDFIAAAKGAYFPGRKNAIIIKTAKSGNPHKVYRFCKLCYILKYKYKKLFIRVR